MSELVRKLLPLFFVQSPSASHNCFTVAAMSPISVGNRVNRVGVDARRENAAFAVENIPTLGGRGERLTLLPFGACHQLRVMEYLQVDEPRLDGAAPRREAHGGDRDTALHLHPPG